MRTPDCHQTDLSRRIAQLSIEQWGERAATVIVGRDEALTRAQTTLLRFAQADAPVLISGATGSGKELFARSLHLLSTRRRRPFLSVNCAQYHEHQLLASELFGHRKGSFTGAIADRAGVFESADRGTVLLDEVAELSAAAQAMLLRVLGEGEIIRVGDSRPRHVDVRVLAASARDLRTMVASGQFREDLFYRLRFLRLHVPSLAERGDDWHLIAEYCLAELNRKNGTAKSLSAASVDRLRQYSWPGNIRELRGIVEFAYCATESALIEPVDFIGELAPGTAEDACAVPKPNAGAEQRNLFAQLTIQKDSFWDIVYQPFMNRELNRAEVTAVLRRGLSQTNGSYKEVLSLFGIAQTDYLKFMDFLRHHDLKPFERRRHRTAAVAAERSSSGYM